MSKYGLQGVYGKPLVKRVAEEKLEEAKQEALERVGEIAIKEIQKQIRKESWKSSPRDLLKSFSYSIMESSLRIDSDHPAAKYIDKGVRAHQMVYLEQADRPIPIITDNGELIFRVASSTSLANGDWYHPGIAGKHFIRKGVDKAKEKVKKEMTETYKDFLIRALKNDL